MTSSLLHRKLERIAESLGKIGVTVAILTLMAIVITTIILTFKQVDRSFDVQFTTDVCDGLVIAIIVVMVAVPEGLPLAVSIYLAYSVDNMFNENNLVMKLNASEAMGNANEICTDITGILTVGTED